MEFELFGKIIMCIKNRSARSHITIFMIFCLLALIHIKHQMRSVSLRRY
jgi:hypothetical protein